MKTKLLVILLQLLIINIHLFAQEEFNEKEINYNYQSRSTLADSNLTQVGEWPWGLCRAVAVKGNYAFIGNGKLVQVLDISNPSNLTVVSEFKTNGYVKDIKLRDTLAFVCSYGLEILDISNVMSIKEIGNLDLIAAIEVVVSDSFAYVLRDGRPPLVSVVDITDPTYPFARSTTPTAADFEIHMDVKDRIIYVTGYNFPVLTIIDASNPDWLVHHDQWIGSNAIVIRDTLMYLGGGSYIGIFSIANPFEPVLLDTLNSSINSSIHKIIMRGNYAFAAGDSGIAVFDISNPYKISAVDFFRTNRGFSLAIQNELLHMATLSGYDIINISKVDSMYHVGYFNSGGLPYDLVIQDKYAYLASGGPGLEILDLSNPISPVRISVCGTNGPASYVSVKGNYAYVSGRGLWTIDVSDHHNPFVTDYDTLKTALDDIVQVDSNRVYLVDTAITIYDITIPAHPRRIAHHPCPYTMHRYAVKDSLLFLTVPDGSTRNIVVYNVQDTANIYEVKKININALWLMIKDTLCYVSSDGGLIILNISQPDFPILGSTPIPGGGGKTVSNGSFVYLLNDNLVLIDVSNPYFPKVVGQVSNCYGDAIAVYQKYIYMSVTPIGIKIFKNELVNSVVGKEDLSITGFKLYQNFPNPFNPVTTIKFYLQHSAFVSMKLFNLLGDELETLFDGWKQVGEYQIRFNAENYPSGVYYYRLKIGNFEQTKKMVVIK